MEKKHQADGTKMDELERLERIS
jgi:hypothetical protein